MGVRHRNKPSPPSSPSQTIHGSNRGVVGGGGSSNSVYSGSHCQSLEDDLSEVLSTTRDGGSSNSTTSSHVGNHHRGLRRRKQLATPTTRRTTLRVTPTLILVLFAVTAISSCSFLLAFTTIYRRPPSVQSVSGDVATGVRPPRAVRGSGTSTANTNRKDPNFPRVVFLEGVSTFVRHHPQLAIDDEFMHVSESTQPEPSEKAHLKGCVPLADWMTDSYPNCNHFHEIALPQSVSWNDTEQVDSWARNQLGMLGKGWFRTTWRWDRAEESVVLKTLRPEREFLKEYFDLHNRDAVAMEQLTASPFVVDVYGYCGQSAINELADFPIDGMQYLEKLSRRLRGMYDHESLLLRLGIAANIASGLADVHRAGGSGRPLMVHYDINPRNIALFRGARPKINDFNIAEFLYYNPQTNETCGFPSRMHAPWWRAPEEVDLENEILLDEKVDVYSLGSTLFHLFTSFSPRGIMTAAREETVRQWVHNGKRPVVLPVLRNSTDPIAATFLQVLDMCHEPDPQKRASSKEIATILMDAFTREKKGMEDLEAPERPEPAVRWASPVDQEESADNGGSNLEEKG